MEHRSPDTETADVLVHAALVSFERLDGLVNNAAVLPVGRPWERGTRDEVRRAVEVNVWGVLNCGAAALQVMVPRGEGAIVNIVSGAALGIPHLSVYGATKGAVLGATYGWALDAGPHGVRVNAVSPLARTRLTDRVDGAGDQSEIASPDSIAPLVVYLLSSKAASVNGQVLRFDGRSLAFQSQPGFEVSSPARREGEWTIDAVADFIEEHSGQLSSAGLSASVPANLRAPD